MNENKHLNELIYNQDETSDKHCPIADENPNEYFQLTSIDGNGRCGDCGALYPSWVSINIGVILCIACSGVHRSLGVGVSKVRSLQLDIIDEDTLQMLSKISNNMVNQVYEHLVHKSQSFADSNSLILTRPTPDCHSIIREQWIIAKYVKKCFIKPFNPMGMLIKKSTTTSGNVDLTILENESSKIGNSNFIFINNINSLLHLACTYGHIPLIMYSLAANADCNSIIYNMFEKDVSIGYTPLIRAVYTSTAAVEYLLQNGVKLDVPDSTNSQTPLHHATILNNLKLVCLLLKRGADPILKDANNLDPIQIAVGNYQANIVTILRVAQMNKQSEEHDYNMFYEMLKDLI